jgi:hypothetical protein
MSPMMNFGEEYKGKHFLPAKNEGSKIEGK